MLKQGSHSSEIPWLFPEQLYTDHTEHEETGQDIITDTEI